MKRCEICLQRYACERQYSESDDVYISGRFVVERTCLHLNITENWKYSLIYDVCEPVLDCIIKVEFTFVNNYLLKSKKGLYLHSNAIFNMQIHYS